MEICVGYVGGGGVSRTLTAKSPISAVKDGGGDPPQDSTVFSLELLSEFSLDVVFGTRAEINKYVYEAEKVQTILPHLNIDENFGRPKTYNKVKP